MVSVIDPSGIDKLGGAAGRVGSAQGFSGDLQAVQQQLNRLVGGQKESSGDHGKDVQDFADAINASLKRLQSRAAQLDDQSAGADNSPKQAMLLQRTQDATNGQLAQLQDTVGKFNQTLHQASSPLRLALTDSGVNVVQVTTGGQNAAPMNAGARSAWLDGVTAAQPGDGANGAFAALDAAGGAANTSPLFGAVKGALEEAMAEMKHGQPSAAAQDGVRQQANVTQVQQAQAKAANALTSSFLAALPKAMETYRAQVRGVGGAKKGGGGGGGGGVATDDQDEDDLINQQSLQQALGTADAGTPAATAQSSAGAGAAPATAGGAAKGGMSTKAASGGGASIKAANGNVTAAAGDPTTGDPTAVDPGLGDPYLFNQDVNALVQSVLMETYKENQQDLRQVADRLEALNQKKKMIRAGLVAARALDPDSPVAEALEKELDNVNDDAQMVQMRLQNLAQNQQQLLQMVSNLSKSTHDDAMAIIRHIGGS